MNAPIMVQMDRLGELGELMSKMLNEYDYKKFFELDRQFKGKLALYKLEDELNKEEQDASK